MIESASYIFIVLGTALFTVTLLGLGVAVGCRFKAGALANSKTPCDCSRIKDWLSVELDSCLLAGEQIERHGTRLTDLVANHADYVPIEISRSVTELLKTARLLSTQLKHAAACVPGGKSPNTRTDTRAETAEPPDAQPFVPRLAARQAELEPPRVAPAATTLSANEMRRFTTPEEVTTEMEDGSVRRRYPYDCFEMVAPYYDDEPEPSDTVVVRCHDISRHGVSFFWPEVPDFEDVLVSIGQGGDVTFMEARVRQSKSVYMHDELAFLVGCEFTKRMPKFTDAWKQLRSSDVAAT